MNEERREWQEIKNKVSKSQPAMELNLELFTKNVEDMKKYAERCDPRLIGFIDRLGRLTNTIRKDAEKLRAENILSDEDYSKFTHELMEYHNYTLAKLIEQLSKCICRK